MIDVVLFIFKDKLSLATLEVRLRYLGYGEVEKHGDSVQRPDLRADSSAHPCHSAAAPRGSVTCCVPDLRAQAVCANRQPRIKSSTFFCFHSQRITFHILS